MNQQIMQQAAVNNAITGGNQQQPPKEQKPPANPDPGAPENANLSTQQFIQRVAPQPGSTNSDRRDGIFR